MKPLKTLIPVLSFLFLNSSSFGQECDNVGFEQGTLDTWTGFTGICCGGGINNPGLVNGRHTVMGVQEFDENSLDSIPKISPLGGMFSVRLGNDDVNYEAERILRSFDVTPDNTVFTYQYALILEDPSGHSPIDKPKFEVRLMDENMDVIPGPCGYYQVTAGPETEDWYKNGDIRFKKWTTVGVDLTPFIGQTMTIEFTVEDCGRGGHFGYAYIDANCGFLDITVEGFCQDDKSNVSLTAPDGFTEYLWSTGDTTRVIQMTDPEVGDSVSVEITNEAGCTSYLKHFFEDIPLIDANIINGDTTICAGEELVLMGEELDVEDTYVWYSDKPDFSSDEQNPTVQPLENTTYFLSALNANGCPNPDGTDSITVIVDNSLVFELNDTETICWGDSVLYVAPNFSSAIYDWAILDQIPFSQDSIIMLIPDETTDYTLTVQNSFCAFSDTFKVEVFSPTTLPDSLNAGFCPGDSVTITAPGGYQTYEWDGLVGTEVFRGDVVDGQIVQLKITSEEGCEDMIYYRVYESSIPTPIISVQNDTICYGTATELIGMGVGYDGNYHWSSDDANLSMGSGKNEWVSPTTSTTFYLRVSDSIGCVDYDAVDTALVFVNDSALFTFPSDEFICPFDSIEIAPIGGTGDYNWYSDPSGFTSTDSSIWIYIDETTRYYLEITNGGCTFTGTIEVEVYESQQEDEEVMFCKDESSITLTAPDNFSTYNWWNQSSNNQSLTINSPSNGSQRVYLVSPEGCSDMKDFILTEIPYPAIQTISDVTICYGESVTLVTTTDFGDNRFSWSSNPVGFSTSQQSPTVSPLVDTRYTVTYFNDLNCVAPDPTATVLVSVNSATLIDLGADKDICMGASTSLVSSTGIGNYSWTSNPAGYSSMDQTVTVSPTATTTYMLTISDALCSNTDQVTVDVHDPLAEIGNGDLTICEGDQETLWPIYSSANYGWYENDVLISNAYSVQVTPAVTSTYKLVVTDSYSCIDEDEIQINVDAYPVVELGEDIKVCIGIPVELNAQNPGATYLWSDGSTTQKIAPQTSGTYYVTVANGSCPTRDDVYVDFIDAQTFVMIPNIFTPNGDDKNQTFDIQYQDVAFFKLEIYNRWGRLIFSTSDPAVKWNGLINGRVASEGAYYYILDYSGICAEDDIIHKTGNVTIVR